MLAIVCKKVRLRVSDLSMFWNREWLAQNVISRDYQFLYLYYVNSYVLLYCSIHGLLIDNDFYAT